MDFVLDTNILVHLIRTNPLIVKLIEEIENQGGSVFISIVSVGEIYSLAYQFGWGKNKLQEVETLLEQLIPIPIENRELAKMYAEIDAYSQNKNPNLSMPKGVSARNMGKNDLWIAATAYLLEASLITTNNDFVHLDGIYFHIVKV